MEDKFMAAYERAEERNDIQHAAKEKKKKVKDMADWELEDKVKRRKLEADYSEYSKGRRRYKRAMDIMRDVSTVAGTANTGINIYKNIKGIHDERRSRTIDGMRENARRDLEKEDIKKQVKDEVRAKEARIDKKSAEVAREYEKQRRIDEMRAYGSGKKTAPEPHGAPYRNTFVPNSEVNAPRRPSVDDVRRNRKKK